MQELAGVIAHELGHVRNRDTLTMTMTAVIAGAIGMLANMAFWIGGGDRRNNPMGFVGILLVTLLAPFAAMLVQAAISRSREFEADRAGAELTGKPLWLANALAAIDSSAKRIENAPADANPATAHMFIVNPLHGGISGLFASHPSTEERIARLRAMAGATAAPVLEVLGGDGTTAITKASGKSGPVDRFECRIPRYAQVDKLFYAQQMLAKKS